MPPRSKSNPKFVAFKNGTRVITLNRGERAFLRFCCQDMPYWEIAGKMGKSPRTIDGYRDTLFAKLGVRSTVGLVIWSLKSGFVKINEIRLTRRKRINRKKKPAAL